MPSRFPRYEQLLRLYPKTYRDTYAQQMVQTLGDMLDDQPSSAGRALVWLRIVWDLPVGIINQNTLALGNNLAHETPGYVRRNGLLAGILLAPFFAALLANALDKVINNHTLYHSWLWSTPMIMIWVLILPALAFAVAAVSYLLFALSDHHQSSLFRRLWDVKRTWPVLLTGLCGLGIIFMLLFHDSVHCWVQNPMHDVTRFHQTWQCTTQGFLGGKS